VNNLSELDSLLPANLKEHGVSFVMPTQLCKALLKNLTVRLFKKPLCPTVITLSYRKVNLQKKQLIQKNLTVRLLGKPLCPNAITLSYRKVDLRKSSLYKKNLTVRLLLDDVPLWPIAPNSSLGSRSRGFLPPRQSRIPSQDVRQLVAPLWEP
jgi:hypothetical protein